MSKFVCDKCKKEKELTNFQIKVVDGKTVCSQAVCCDDYMTKQRDRFGGWGSIRRGPDGSVKRKPRPWE